MKILIIDDNADFADALKKLLKVAGYGDVRSAYTGEDGIKKASVMRPDFLFVDLLLRGGKDGFSVVRELRRTLTRAPTTVAITGRGRESDRVETRSANFDFHLIKPVSFKQLQEILGAPKKLAVSKRKV